MKLFYMPGACSLASHIVLEELGEDYQIVRVGRDKQTEDGRNFLSINAKGAVPTLELDDGEVLTEGPAILQFLADRAGSTTLSPRAGTMERARVTEMLNFVGSGLHMAFKPLFKPDTTEEGKAAAREAVGKQLDWLESRFADGRAYPTGPEFTVGDAYAFVVCTWAPRQGIDLAGWPNVAAFVERVSQRPATVAAMTQEGLR